MKQFIFLLLMIFASAVFPQNKKFNSEDVMINSTTFLVPSKLEDLQWLPGYDAAYSYNEHDGDQSVIMIGYASTGKKESFVSLSELNAELIAISNEKLDTLPEIDWIDDKSFCFWIDNNLYSYDKKTNSVKLILNVLSDFSNQSIAPNFEYAAYTLGNDLYVSISGGSQKRITLDGSHNITNGMPASRNEFGIDSGIFWSPNSEMIAFYREDLSEVTDYPLIKIETRPASVEWIKYPMSGMKSQKVSIGIYNLQTAETIWLEADDDENQYLTSVTWAPNCKTIYVAHLNRDQNHLRLIEYDAISGKRNKILFEEKNDKYVEPEHPLYFNPKKPDTFLWFSKRDGWNHLYLYKTDGKLIKQLTSGDYDVTEFHGFDSAGENVFITSTKESPIERHFFRVNISTSEQKKFTVDAGTHTVKMHSSGFYFIDEFSSLTNPGETRVIDYNGKMVGLINQSENPLSDYAIGKIEIFPIKAEDGTLLYCRLIYPPDFDAAKKYPVITYVYNGPHSQKVTNEWITDKYQIWFKEMAQNGYIIFTLDGRGTSNRGLKFEQATFRNLGKVELHDQLIGLNYLKTLPFVDDSRLGIYGWSYGGFMATNMMLNSNQAYKVTVAGGAVIDWRYYEIMYTERYMDTPETNPEGYHESNLLNYIKNLKGKMLMLHGTSDPTVPWQNTLLFIDKAVELNIPIDYFPYYDHGHHVLKREGIHLYDKITKYFLDNL